jgi:hypothetical protein
MSALPPSIVLSVLLLWPLAASAQFEPAPRLPALTGPLGLIASGNLFYQAFRIPSESPINIIAKILIFTAGFVLMYEVYLYFFLSRSGT